MRAADRPGQVGPGTVGVACRTPLVLFRSASRERKRPEVFARPPVAYASTSGRLRSRLAIHQALDIPRTENTISFSSAHGANCVAALLQSPATAVDRNPDISITFLANEVEAQL